MIFKKTILLCFLFSTLLKAQEGELSLDPNDIPLTPDPTLEAPPVDNTVTVPALDVQPPIEPGATPIAPPVEVAKPAPLVKPPPARVEEFKPTPSNLEVKSDKKSNDNSSQKEERFTKAYGKFHKDSTSDQNWEKVVGKRTADTYVVNKGDTLWDISGTLFGDPFYWPKVWSLNRDLIYNPHVIFPDMKIKFYQGNSKTAPTLATDNQPGAVTPAPDEKKTLETNGPVTETPVAKSNPNTETKLENEKVPGGPKENIVSQPLKHLPKFFKDKALRLHKEVDVQIEEHKYVAMESIIKLEFYVAEGPLASAGEIVEVESELKSAGDDQYVFVKFASEPSGIYSAVKPGKFMQESRDSTATAMIHEVEGEIKVLGKVNSEENIYRCQVLRSNTLVSEGSILIPGRMRNFKLTDAAKESTATKGRIIGNLNDYGIVGQGSFVLINQGSQSGYQADLKLPIFEDLAKRNSRSLVKENPQKVGTLVIAEVTQNFSIGYIDRIYNRVMVLDYVGTADGGAFNPKDSASTKGEESLDEAAPAPTQEINSEEF